LASQTRICQEPLKAASNPSGVINSVMLMLKGLSENPVLSNSLSAKSIGITRVCRDTTLLLPKSLPKPSFGMAFSFTLLFSAQAKSMGRSILRNGNTFDAY